MSDDVTLLRQYISDRSESAFAELVRRHVDLVHSVALRQIGGDPHRAQDVTQAVFCEMARKAPRLVHHRALSGWLYTTARFVGARVQRAETRRIARELAAHTMTPLQEPPASDLAWNELQPVLDGAMQQLGEKDRHAIVLRFFENKALSEVGKALGLTENAARMRVERAIEKLRVVLARRGITSTASGLGAVLAASAVVPAPASLAATLVGPALACGAASTSTAFGLTLSFFHAMNSAKVGFGVAALALASAVGTYVTLDRANTKLRAELAALLNQTVASTAPASENRPPPDSQSDVEELAKLRAEHGELVRLRGDMSLARQDQAELGRLRAEKAQSARSADPLPDRNNNEPAKAFGIAKMTFAKAWGQAFLAYAQTNGGTMPATLQDAIKYFPPVPEEWKWSVSSFSPDDFEIVFHGSLNDIEHPERIIIFREKQPYDVQPSGLARRTYLFADGHSEIHSAGNGDFEPWEKEHLTLVGQ